MTGHAHLRCCGLAWPRTSVAPLDATLSREAVRQTYNRIAWIYDVWAALTESKAQRRALDLARVQDGSAILEVAVGTGRTFAELVARNPSGETIGIDLTEGMLAKARRRLAGVDAARYRLEQGDAFALPYAAGQFDLLVNQYMFDLIPHAEMDALIGEFRRVLKEGGTLILTNMTPPEGIGGQIYEWIYRLAPRAMGGCRPVALSERLRRHGFEVDRREYVQQLLFPSEIIIAYNQEARR